MTKFDPILSLVGRTTLALIFLLSGLSKVSAYAATQGYMETYGIPGALLAPTILFEITAGIALIAGFQTRLVALATAGFTLVSAVIFHSDFADQMQLIMFLKNVSIMGGLLLLVRHGAGEYALDAHLNLFGRKSTS